MDLFVDVMIQEDFQGVGYLGFVLPLDGMRDWGFLFYKWGLSYAQR